MVAHQLGLPLEQVLADRLQLNVAEILRITLDIGELLCNTLLGNL